MKIVKNRLKNIPKWLYEYFIVKNNLQYLVKRIIYILCMVCLCQVDQIAGSGTYETILGAKNRTLLVVGIIILTAYDIKDFIKLPYLIWIIVYGLYALLSFDGWKEVVEVEELLKTNLWVAGLYGILLIRMVYKFAVERKKPQIRWIPFIVCMVILLGMIFIRTDYDWPKAILMICVFLFLTDFKEKDLNNLYCGILDGIIVGFFVIQIQAWMYRPYDFIRYMGMYTHPNLNALFYLCAYCAFLGKWYLWKLKQKNMLFRIPFILLAGLVVGTMFYTGGRASFIAAVVITFVFLIFQSISRKKWKIIEFMLDGFLIVAAIGMCILPAFWLIRYIPMYVREPLYFAADEISGLDKKINKFDQNDSPKYIEFNEAIPYMFGRYLWFLDETTAEALEAFIRDFPDSLKPSLQVDAAELHEAITFKPIAIVEPGSDRYHPLIKSDDGEGVYDSRIDIYRYFLGKLKWIGEENTVQGVWLSKTYQASHCHNVFLQFAYDFGIIVGVIFILFILISYITALIGLIKRRTGQNYFRLFVCVGYTTLFVTFGMLEQDWAYGQLAFTMFWLVQYVIVHKEPEKVSAGRKVAPIQVELPLEEDGLEILDLDSEEGYEEITDVLAEEGEYEAVVDEEYADEVDWQMD